MNEEKLKQCENDRDNARTNLDDHDCTAGPESACDCSEFGEREYNGDEMSPEEAEFLNQYNEDEEKQENDLILAHELGARIEPN